MAEPVEGSRHAFTGARQRFLTPRDVPTKPSKDLTHFFHCRAVLTTTRVGSFRCQGRAGRKARQALIWVVFSPPKLVVWLEVPLNEFACD